MDIQYELLNKLPFWRQIRAARAISKVVCAEAANDKMKWVSPSELLAGRFSLLALDGVKVVGHVRTEGAVVGALYVDPDYRGKRIAQALIAGAAKDVVGQKLQPVAYCNQSSIGAFEKCGFSKAAEQDKPNRTKMLGPMPTARDQHEFGIVPISLVMAPWHRQTPLARLCDNK